MQLVDTIPVGLLDQEVTWKIRPTTRDSYGGTVQSNSGTDYSTWTTHAVVMAYIRTARGNQITEGDRPISEVVKEVMVHCDPATLPTNTMVGLHGDKAYQVVTINNVGERNRFVSVIVRQIK